MTEAKVSNGLLITIILLIATMMIWTIDMVSDINHTQIPTTISAFNA